MYKLIAIDIDGTLLDSNHLLQKETIKKIQMVKSKGIKIILVSGRDYLSAKAYMDMLNTKDLLIGLNGCIVYDYLGNIIHNEYLSYNISNKIIKYSKSKNLYTVLFIGKDTYVEEKYNFMDVLNYVKDPIEIKDFNNFYENKPITKFLFVDHHDKLCKVQHLFKSLFKDKINIQFTLPNFLEVFNGTMDKGIMLKKLCAKYNIDKNEVMAIGDFDNDISMIEYAGIGISMGNGSYNLKQKADFITKTNDNLGVCFALDKFIFNK